MFTSGSTSLKPRRRGRPLIVSAGYIILACVVALGTLVTLSKLFQAEPPRQTIPVTVATAEWLPYIGPDLENDGPVGEILTDVFRNMGYDVTFTYSNWEAAELEALNGPSIGMAPVVAAPGRLENGEYSDSLLDFSYVLFGKDDGLLPAWEGASDTLDGARVARISGYQYWDELDNSGAQFTDFSTSLEAFNALQQGEVDLVAEGRIAGETILASSEFTDDATRYRVLNSPANFASNTQGLHLYVSDRTESLNLLHQFNDALNSYQNSAKYRQTLTQLTGETQSLNLRSDGSAPMLLDLENRRPIGQTPSGTTGVLISWPQNGANDDLVTLKLTNGPYAGRIVLVTMKDVEIVNE